MAPPPRGGSAKRQTFVGVEDSHKVAAFPNASLVLFRTACPSWAGGERRRTMRRPTAAFLAVTIGLLTASFVFLVAPVQAGVSWCRVDPIVRLDGVEVQIIVAIPAEYQQYVNGPIEVKIKTPKSVAQELVMTDAGFNGHGETVDFSTKPGNVERDGSFDTHIQVRVPIDKKAVKPGVKVPVEVTVYPGGDAPVHVEYGHDKVTNVVVKVHGKP